VTNPGLFVFEASVVGRRSGEGDNGTELSVKEDIGRLSKFNTDLSCVKDPTTQLYCYCKT
jgi:hypothetical protein